MDTDTIVLSGAADASAHQGIEIPSVSGAWTKLAGAGKANKDKFLATLGTFALALIGTFAVYSVAVLATSGKVDRTHFQEVRQQQTPTKADLNVVTDGNNPAGPDF